MNIENFILIFGDYGVLITFLGGLIGGEEAIITLAFLSAAGLFPLWWIVVFSTIGVYLSDIIILFIGRSNLINNFQRLEKYSKVYQKIDYLIVKISKKNLFLTLLYTKFLYGTRVLTLIYLGIKKVKLTKFLIYDFIVVCIWIIPIILVGWLGGSSFRVVINVFKKIELTIILVIIFIILIILIRTWIKTKLLKLRKQLD
jgi:membrane protein DedA with SNARE-associated domain